MSVSRGRRDETGNALKYVDEFQPCMIGGMMHGPALCLCCEASRRTMEATLRRNREIKDSVSFDYDSIFLANA